MISSAVFIPAVFIGDKIAKDRAEKTLSGGKTYELPHGIAKLRLCHNKGAMLNFCEKHPGRVRKYSCFVSAGLTAVYVYFLVSGKSGMYRLAAALALSGAYSNTTDRFTRGYVVDYVAFPFAGKFVSKLGFKKAGRFVEGVVFNISDLFIIAGEITAIAAILSREPL